MLTASLDLQKTKQLFTLYILKTSLLFIVSLCEILKIVILWFELTA